jgi:hypothetical protein
MAMADKKDILLHLYGETDSPAELRSLLEDDTLRKEHAALSEVKFRLDHRPTLKPDSAAVDKIVSEAGKLYGVPERGRRIDRQPVFRARPLRRLLVPALSVAAAVVVTVGIGLFASDSFESEPSRPDFANSAIENAPPESLLRATPIPENLVGQSERFTSDPMLAWDEDDRLHDVYRRIQTMRPANDLDWGEPIPLESLSGLPRNGRDGLKQVGSHK